MHCLCSYMIEIYIIYDIVNGRLGSPHYISIHPYSSTKQTLKNMGCHMVMGI